MPHNAHTIETKRLLLKALSVEHFPALYEISKNPRSIEDYQLASPDHAYFLKWVEEAMGKSTMSWVVLAEGNVCGLISLENVMEPAAELGYFITESHQNRGLGSEAIKAIIDHIPSALPHIRAIQAQVTASNIASGRVLEKNGFMKVRTVWQNWKWRGTLHDSIEYEFTVPIGADADIRYQT